MPSARGGELRSRQSAQYPYSSLYGVAGGGRSAGARGRPKRGGRGTKAGATVNPWIAHVKRYAKAHNIMYGDALKKARASYRG